HAGHLRDLPSFPTRRSSDLGNPEVPEKLRQAKGHTAQAIAGRGEELWVAVLPFKSSGDAQMESFANGLGEDITTGLSRFRYLLSDRKSTRLNSSHVSISYAV